MKRYNRVKTLPNVVTYDPHAEETPYPWADAQTTFKKTILELGCGKGEHSLGFATADPSCLCIGVDLKSHRLCVGGEKALDRGMENVFFLRARVEEISAIFPDHSVHEIWLTFSDPHPKQRSIKHRLSSANFLHLYSRLLVPGGTVHLKTDNDLLYNYTRDSANYWGGKILVDMDDLHGEEGNAGDPARLVVSAFESKALARKETIKYIAFTLD
ncbi:MAG: tRNA (guanosine(46)-N7)-methyltransferase TrmB [Desulfobacterales bacterium]|nr:tRNA (guanosine(46)-N7)-methyltransferase TrmB [Desulfobacterales bacterium]